MTPKEKAKDIFVKMMEYIPDSIIPDNINAKEVCKIHALICVDEIINETGHYQDLVSVWHGETGIKSVVERYQYWQEVKQEIQAL